MEIKVSGMNDKEAIKALVDIQQYKKSNPKTAFAGRVFFSGSMVLLLWGSYLFTSFGKDMIGAVIAVTVIFALCLLVVLLGPNLAYKRNGKLADAVNHFTFTDDYVKIEGRGEGFSNEGTFNYESFDRVYETSKYIFVYINKLSAYIIDKKTIAPEDYEPLKEKLLSAVGKKKYIVCKY